MSSFKCLVLAIGFGLTAGAALATCPKNAPRPLAGTLASDQRVDEGWLADTLTGRELDFTVGTEFYNSDGSYAYLDKATGETFPAPSYAFYRNGMRCIGYANGPRFDLIVYNDGDIVLINRDGERYVGVLKN